jgi:hypothetical protein
MNAISKTLGIAMTLESMQKNTGIQETIYSLEWV